MTTRQKVWCEAYQAGRDFAMPMQTEPVNRRAEFADRCLVEFDKRWPDQEADEDLYLKMRGKPITFWDNSLMQVVPGVTP